MVNNMIYGMTGGQVAPTTPTGFTTMTSPYGCIDPPLDACKVAIACGASYVARWTTLQSRRLIESIKTGIQKNGLSYIEVVAPCPTMYGRYAAKIGEPVALLKWIREKSISSERAEKLSKDELKRKLFILGEFLNVEKPTAVEEHYRLLETCMTEEGQ